MIIYRVFIVVIPIPKIKWSKWYCSCKPLKTSLFV